MIASMVACGGSSSDGLDDLASEMEGIYQVSAYTHNDAACAPGGSSQLGSDTFAFVKTQTFFGQKLVEVLSCASPADCHAKAAALEAGQSFGIEFSFGASELGGEGTLVGHGADTGFGENGVCVGGEATVTTLFLDGDVLQVEHGITIADDYPVDSRVSARPMLRARPLRTRAARSSSC